MAQTAWCRIGFVGKCIKKGDFQDMSIGMKQHSDLVTFAAPRKAARKLRRRALETHQIRTRQTDAEKENPDEKGKGLMPDTADVLSYRGY